MNKKGVSEVVTAILLILLAVAAVIIVWQVIRPMIEGTGDKIQTSCLSVSANVITGSEEDNTITVKRNAGAGKVVKVLIAVHDVSGSESQIFTEELGELSTKTYTMSEITLTGWTKAEVALIVNEGGGEVTCPSSGEKLI